MERRRNTEGALLGASARLGIGSGQLKRNRHNDFSLRVQLQPAYDGQNDTGSVCHVRLHNRNRHNDFSLRVQLQPAYDGQDDTGSVCHVRLHNSQRALWIVTPCEPRANISFD
jgi:hypothetical protein